MSIKIKLLDNSSMVMAYMKAKALGAMRAIGNEAEKYAKDECPVDTSRLKNSISNKVVDSEVAMYVGTNVEYAPYVELGEKARHISGKAHFIRDSIAIHGERYKDILEAALKS